MTSPSRRRGACRGRRGQCPRRAGQAWASCAATRPTADRSPRSGWSAYRRRRWAFLVSPGRRTSGSCCEHGRGPGRTVPGAGADFERCRNRAASAARSGAGRSAGAGSGVASRTQRRSPPSVEPGARASRSPYSATFPATARTASRGAADSCPGRPLLITEHVTADHRDNPVGDDREEHRRHDVRGDAARRSDVCGRVVHGGRPERAHHDQGPLDPRGLPRTGQAERQQRENDHPGVEGDEPR